MPNLSNYELEEVKFIGGTKFYLDFEIKNENGLPVDITSATCKLTVCEIGRPDVKVLTLTGTRLDNYTFRVIFLDAHTRYMWGKYIYQPILIDPDGEQYRPGQGILYIIARIIE
jgi:hypothetical protein